MILGWGLVTLSWGLANAISYSNRWDAFLTGVIGGATFGFMIMVIMVWPLMAVLLFVLHKLRVEGWKRWLIALAPCFLLVGMALFSALQSRNSQGRLESIFDVELSESVDGMKSWSERYGMDSVYAWSFSTSGDDVQRLLAVREFTEKPWMEGYDPLTTLAVDVPSGWPDPNRWSDSVVYRASEGSSYWYVITDQSEQNVLLIAGDI